MAREWRDADRRVSRWHSKSPRRPCSRVGLRDRASPRTDDAWSSPPSLSERRSPVASEHSVRTVFAAPDSGDQLASTLWSWPFWSPDSRYVAFVADGKLKRVEPDAGVVETIATVDGQFGGGSWSKNGTVLVASNDHGLRLVPAAGGPLTDVSKREPGERTTTARRSCLTASTSSILPTGTSRNRAAIFVSEIGTTTRTCD